MTFAEYVAHLDQIAAADAERLLGKLQTAGPDVRGLFIDCGSNLGQGFRHFVRHYPLSHFDYVLIEPNPNCAPELQRIVDEGNGRIELIGEAASTQDGTIQFFGLEIDPRSQGGSTLKEHNSAYYQADATNALTVTCFSLADFIERRSQPYGCTVLKLDIEGGEYEVIPDLIKKQAHKKIDAAYIEFHTQYMAEPAASEYREIEEQVKRQLSDDGVAFSIWL